MKKIIKIGIFGLGRGSHLIRDILANNGEVVAICDFDTDKLEKIKNMLGDVATYTDFDAFIRHEGMEAVMLANYFHEHAPYAIKALERGIHVVSDCTSNGTMADGVALVRAAEKSSAIYMMGEDFQFMKFNQEMKRVYEGGTLGSLIYAEGEYNHALDPNDVGYVKTLRPHAKHWRIHLPAAYYITHSLGPLMYITGSKPLRVTAMPAVCPFREEEVGIIAWRVAERAAIITTFNDDNSVYRVTGVTSFGATEDSYRVCGERGQIENIRGSEDILLRYNPWHIPEGGVARSVYTPEWRDPEEKLIRKSGHGGADFFVLREFFSCIRENKKPFFDVYRATTMASVAILAHRSMLQFGVPYDVPDFRREEDRVKYENDKLSPFYGSDGSEPTIASSTRPDWQRTPEAMERYTQKVSEIE